MYWLGLPSSFHATFVMSFLAHDWMAVHPYQLQDLFIAFYRINLPWNAIAHDTIRVKIFWERAQRYMEELQHTSVPSIQEATAVFFLSFVTFLRKRNCKWLVHIPGSVHLAIMTTLVQAEPYLTSDNFRELLDQYVFSCTATPCPPSHL